jgi:hypothetical protein
MEGEVTGRIYTLPEAAAALRKSPRWLQAWLKRHPRDERGLPYFSPLGRTKTFDEDDLARIRHKSRCEHAENTRRCRSKSSRPAKAKAPTIQSGAPTAASMWTRAAALTNDPSLLECFGASKPKSRAATTAKPHLKLVASQPS